MPDRDFNNFIVNNRPSPVSMGAAGWGDTMISNLDLLFGTYRYYGLLAAKIGLDLGASAEATLFTLTALELHVHVDRILVFRRGTTPSASAVVSFGSNASTYNDWQPDVALNGLVSDDNPLEILPDHSGTVYSNTVGRVLGTIGANNEDSPLYNSFRIKETSGNAVAAELDFYVYGALIQRDL